MDHVRIILVLAGCFLASFAVLVGASDPAMIHRDTGCGSETAWQLTVTAWEEANTDASFDSWWSSQQGVNLSTQLASQFGAQSPDFSCGINDQGSCTLPDCKPYVDAGDQPWSYLALCAVVNVDTFLNKVWQGISTGQQDFSDQATAMAQTFFPWKEPKFGASDAAIWIGATVGLAFAFLNPESRLLAAGVKATTAFIAAASQEVQLQLTPNPDLTLLEGIGVLTTAAATSSEQARNAIEDWASTLFSGQLDSTNNTLLDYMYNGSFIRLENVMNADLEGFWKLSLMSRTINSQWNTRPNFVTFARPTNSSIDVGPNLTKYYSPSDGGVYYLYQWKNGKLDYPDGLLELPKPPWNIQAWEPTMSSALSFKAAGFNYTPAIALDRLKGSLLNTTMNPAENLAHTEGLWTIPVCNMSDFVQWNGQYKKDKMAPCCCGENCRDTKMFVQQANLTGDQHYLKQCRQQLKAVNITFSAIDYGFHLKPLSTGQIVGIAVGCFVGAVAIVGFCCCLGCCLLCLY